MGLYDILNQELKKIIKNFIILYPDKQSVNIFSDLIGKYKPIGNKVFDIEIVSVMKSKGIKKIATVNYKDFENINEIEVITI